MSAIQPIFVRNYDRNTVAGYLMLQKLISDIKKDSKSSRVKRDILVFLMNNGFATIASMAKELNLSVPTVAKFTSELTSDSLLCECGKLETNGGRQPVLYDLNPNFCYFCGVDIKGYSVSVGLIDFCGKMIESKLDMTYHFANNRQSLDQLCGIILDFIHGCKVNQSLIVGVSVNISGRVNPNTGHSYVWYNFGDEPLADVLTRQLGIRTIIENDTRAMTLGEYKQGQGAKVANMLFVNLSWGLGVGMVIDHKLYCGKSGFSGELGHMVTCDNEVLCHCGKKGCLETEASGSAMHRKFVEAMNAGENSCLQKQYKENGNVSLSDLIEAVTVNEDLLCISIVEEMGNTLGRWLAGLINIFNPEKVVIGGSLAATGDYLLQPIRTHVRRYSLNLVNQDTEIVLSDLHGTAGLIGACETARCFAFNNN